MSWKQQTVPAPLIDGVQDVADTLNSAAAGVETTLGTLSSLLEAAKAFAATAADPFVALANAIVNELEELINDTFNTGLSYIVITPSDLKNIRQFDSFGTPLMTPKKCLRELVRSINDTSDLNRPNFSDSAEVAAIGFLVTAPDASSFVALSEALSSVFSIAEFEKWLNRMKRKHGLGEFELPASGRARVPNWEGYKLNQIPILKQQQQALLKALAIFRGYLVTADDALGDMIKIIERKVNSLTALLAEFTELIDTINNAVGASGVYVLDVEAGIGGNTRLATEFRDDDLEDLRQNGYTAAIVFVGGGPTLAGVETLRSLFSDE